jgi:hypothetical protein
MTLKYFERTKKASNGHMRPNCFVLDGKRLNFYHDRELILELTKKMLDNLDHCQVYEVAQRLIKSNALRAKRETNVETSMLSCKDSSIANTWEVNV